QLDAANNELVNSKQQLDAIQNSLVFKSMRKIDNKFPEGTRRGEVRKITVRSLHIVAEQGFKTFLRMAQEKIKRREFRIVDAGSSTLRIEPISHLPLQMEMSLDDTKVINRKVSVVIPTKNSGPEFELTLEKLKNQKGIKEIEIVVVDSGSEDDTVRTAKRYTNRVYSVTPKEFNHGATRNFGAEQASGDYILFNVDDAVPIGDYWLYNIVKVLENDSQVGAVTCRQVPKSDADLFACISLRTHYDFLNFHQDRVSPHVQESISRRKKKTLPA
ncbi:MAG: glycosyltransferase family A protein, partial [Nitrososphaerales archaeon]